MDKSVGQQFLDILNEHIVITEATGTRGGELEYLVSRLKENDEGALDRFVTDLFYFADRLAPAGKNVVVSEGTGFRLESETEPATPAGA